MSAFDPKRTFGSQAFCTAMGHFLEAGLTRYDPFPELGEAMRRREFITLIGGAAVAWPPSTRGQTGATRRIGALIAFSKDDPETEERLAGFQQGLAKRGWVDGGNIHIDYRFAAGRPD